MAQVTVNIAGRTFRMACGDGEEYHLEALARQVDEKITELRGAFGEIGDHRLIVMAAISVADELAESKARVTRLESEVAALRVVQATAAGANAIMSDAVATALDEAAMRIERAAKAMR